MTKVTRGWLIEYLTQEKKHISWISRESTPERKVSVVSNIFVPKATTKTSSVPSNIFSQPKENLKPDPVNIFVCQMDRSPERPSTTNIFAAPPGISKIKKYPVFL